MFDREKVIKAVECRKNVHKRCGNPCEWTGNCVYAKCIRGNDGEPYYPCYCDDERLFEDVLALLREQEPVQFKVTRQDKSYPFWDSVCTGCGYKTSAVKDYWKYCPVCGRKVKWE